MKPVTEKLLSEFSGSANWGSLGHPLDMPRFWDFVIQAHKSGDRHISFESFNTLIKPYCENEDSVHRMYQKYQDGIDLLKRHSGA